MSANRGAGRAVSMWTTKPSVRPNFARWMLRKSLRWWRGKSGDERRHHHRGHLYQPPNVRRVRPVAASVPARGQYAIVQASGGAAEKTDGSHCTYSTEFVHGAAL